MNVQRFFGTTTREALAQVRARLGDDALILRNRSVDGGIEILAASGDDLGADSVATGNAPPPASPHAAQDAPDAGRRPAPTTPRRRAAAPVPPAMSTLSFENYARQRASGRGVDSIAGGLREAPANRVGMAGADDPAPLRLDGHGEQATVQASQHLVDELRLMRSYISQQFSALSWVDGVRRTPVQAALLRRLIAAGFSARLSRLLVSRLPADHDDDEALVWLHAALARNLRCNAWPAGIPADGGVFALVGPTGVGKTTTAAKIAAHFALRHGIESVGLVTMDAYRIAARDQLEAFGRLIGLPVLAARDAGELRRHLDTLADRPLVLVDTAGIGQRDERVGGTIEGLAENGVQRLLVLAASAQEDALEEVIEAYRGRDAAGIVLSKVDETPRLGGALDALVRHRLPLVGVADGQRVPEDWHGPDAASLVATALEPRVHDDFLLDDTELVMLMQRIDGIGNDPSRSGAAHG